MTKEKTLGVALVKEACPLCGATFDGPIIMNTLLSKKRAQDVEALQGKVIGYSEEPCDSCKDLMSQGFLLIGIIEEKTDSDSNPWRSGHQWVIKHEAAVNLLGEDKVEKGAAFIDLKAAERVGLPIQQLNPKGEA